MPGDDSSKSRLSTAEDLVICAAEGRPERLKVELRLYRQQLEQVHVLERLDMAAWNCLQRGSSSSSAWASSWALPRNFAGSSRNQAPMLLTVNGMATGTRPDPEESAQDELLSASSPNAPTT
ncbi:unnamed protein product [Durusdinium trenchii]|uniref:Uncharacterized protein n=1 Tax=Durusdinium trenchii TaxID=1381693 RepID=A0ABP0PRW9_9DINO